jgi:hypothetical protein
MPLIIPNPLWPKPVCEIPYSKKPRRRQPMSPSQIHKRPKTTTQGGFFRDSLGGSDDEHKDAGGSSSSSSTTANKDTTLESIGFTWNPKDRGIPMIFFAVPSLNVVHS